MATTKRAPVARRVLEMAESATLAMTKRAIELRAKGVDIISLSAGEPDFDTPEHIKDAALEAMRQGKTKYTIVSGIAELREAIAAKFKRDQGLKYDPSQVLVSCGAKHAIYNILQALVDPGDEVLIPAPYWTSYPEMVKCAGGKPVIVQTTESDGFVPSAEALERAINSKTKALLYSSPTNPTGGVYPESLLRRIAEVLDETDIIVISDEVYEKLIYGDNRHFSIAQIGPDLYERTIVVNGVSKTYAMTGWRIGYAAGPRDIIAAAAKIQGQSTSNANTMAQYASLAALTGDQSCIDAMVAEYTGRRELVLSRLAGMTGLRCRAPDGTFYVFPNVSALFGKAHAGRPVSDSVTLAELLLEEAKIAAVPGSGFGSPDHIRLSYAASTEALTEALNRLDRFIRELL